MKQQLRNRLVLRNAWRMRLPELENVYQQARPLQRLISRLITFSAGISRKMSAQCLFYKPTPIPTT